MFKLCFLVVGHQQTLTPQSSAHIIIYILTGDIALGRT